MKQRNSQFTDQLSRRQVLKGGLLLSLACLSPVPSWANISQLRGAERSLSMTNLHTGELLKDVVYWESGRYIPDALENIDYVLRDHRTNDIHPIDPMTLDLMAAISRKVGAKGPFQIISGYRSPQTNKLLNNSTNGVAKKSYHMQGKAVDLRLPGVPLKALHKAALELRMGGVGYYPKSDFVHVDSGRVRSW